MTQRIKLLLFNVQDLFLRLAYDVTPQALEQLSDAEWLQLAPQDQPIKPLTQLRGLAHVILSEEPDVVMICEAGGEESLANFSRLFLNDSYRPYATPSISDRGIDTAYLVRRDLPLRIELISHADELVAFKYPHEADPINYAVTAEMAQALDLGNPEARKLSRDVAEMRFFRSAQTKPVLVTLLAHLKSGYDPLGIDRGGFVQRQAEFEVLLRIRQQVLAELGCDAPLVVAGDFNGRAARIDTGPEFASLYASTDLEDALEVAGREPFERLTHVTYFLETGRASQLDYVFVAKSLQPRVVRDLTYVHRYKFAEDGQEMQMPRSIRDRKRLPSDHFPVVCVIDL